MTDIQPGGSISSRDHLQRLHRAQVLLLLRGKLCQFLSTKVVDIYRDRVRILFLTYGVSSGVEILVAKRESALREQDAGILLLIRRAVPGRVDQTRQQDFSIRELNQSCVALLRGDILTEIGRASCRERVVVPAAAE